MRIVIFGNSGSGKSTMARAIAEEQGIEHMDLDGVAWETPGVRMPLVRSAESIAAFTHANDRWVIEGCYADLLELVISLATEVRFLNPGTEACVVNCRSRPWEPHKYESPEAQEKMLEFLLGWVRDYDVRDDEYSLASHRALFDRFTGTKREYDSLPPLQHHPTPRDPRREESG